VQERLKRFGLRRADGTTLALDEMPSARAIRGETYQNIDYLVDGENGPDTIISVSGAPLRGPQSTRRGGVIVFRNVTQLRQLEHRTHQALGALLGMAGVLIAPTATVAGARPGDSSPSHRPPLAGPELPQDVSAVPDSLGATLRQLCELAIGVLGCDRVAINLVEPMTLEMTPGAVAGLSPEQDVAWLAQQQTQRERGERRRLGAGLDPSIRERLLAGEVALVDLARPSSADLPNPYGMRLILAVPLLVEQQLVGVLALDHVARSPDEPVHQYTDEEIALARGVARLAALAVERQRLARTAAEVEALRAANALKEEFLSIASHELKTPLTVLQARTQATQRRLVRMGHPDAAAQFATVQASLDRILGLVEELLDASRIEAGRLDLHPERCDLGTLVTAAVGEQREASDRAIVLEGADVPGLTVEGDRERLAQVLTNLLDNAAKYSPQGAPVQVRVWRQLSPTQTEAAADGPADHQHALVVAAEELVVSIRDEGVGIPPDEVDKVFGRFFRARTASARQYGGLGLGLHIAATIVERHGGRIWAESPGPGLGSTFGIALPALPAGSDPEP
jgi:signal transduction histidine kinase